jgi:hypothetical protein
VRRVLKIALYAVAALPMGGVAVVALLAWLAMRKVRAADPKWSPTLAVLFWARVWTAVYRVPFAFELSLLHNEGSSTLRAPKAGELQFFDDPPDLVYPLGDTAIAKGPSVGAGDVLRTNVEALWASPLPWWLPSWVVTAPSPGALGLCANCETVAGARCRRPE